MFLSDEGPMLETLDYTIRIGSTPTTLYFDLYLYSAYTQHTTFIIYIDKHGIFDAVLSSNSLISCSFTLAKCSVK